MFLFACPAGWLPSPPDGWGVPTEAGAYCVCAITRLSGQGLCQHVHNNYMKIFIHLRSLFVCTRLNLDSVNIPFLRR